ncbi:MAG: Trk system potassium transporter TrkA [Ruminococcaceae bacterium]|nr:Trk system potassium transporter TrkA [Oscillospiraceae bacterium]
MKIIVVGCGKIGLTIIKSLVAEGHDVTVVESDPRLLEEVTNIHDVMGVCGNGVDCETLAEAGVDKTDLLVAVTGSDEQNMLSCFVGRRMGAKETIARIRKPEYNDDSLVFFKQQLGLSMAINPERLAADELYHLLKLPSAMKVETFSRRNFEMVEMRLKEDSPFVGQSLSALRGKHKAKFLVCLVQRGNTVYIPDGNFILQAGDHIGLTAASAEIHKLMKSMGLTSKQARNVMILGGSRTAYYLAKRLLTAGSHVKIIESDRALCEELCEALPGAVIINGDGAKQELLLEEGLGDMDAFVSLTGMDEENILLSFFASSHDVPKVVSKVNRDELGALAERLGLDSVVSPRDIIADVLVRYARALQNSMGSNIETLYTLMDDQAEAVEFNVKDDARLVRRPLKELKFKSNILIAGILRNRSPIIPTGDDMILPGDRVVVMCAGHRLQDLSDILG